MSADAVPADPLREALEDVLRVFDAPFSTSPEQRNRIRRRAEDALAAQPSVPRTDDGLDVERLARALLVAWPGMNGSPDPEAGAHLLAARVAAEYARLVSDTEGSTDRE